jgi:hypothetical protein
MAERNDSEALVLPLTRHFIASKKFLRYFSIKMLTFFGKVARIRHETKYLSVKQRFDGNFRGFERGKTQLPTVSEPFLYWMVPPYSAMRRTHSNDVDAKKNNPKVLDLNSARFRFRLSPGMPVMHVPVPTARVQPERRAHQSFPSTVVEPPSEEEGG